MSTLKATNIKNESSASNNIVLDSGGGVVVSGILTATTFSGDATGLTGTPNLNVGVVTATSFSGSGSGLTGVGKILQVVENNSSTTQTSSTTTYSSLITASITPSSSSNKILIHCSVDLNITANTNAYAGIAIYRGTTSDTELVGRISGVNSGVSVTASLAAFWLDSPATTSSQTYTMAFRKGSVNTTSVSTDAKLYNIVLMEVAA